MSPSSPPLYTASGHAVSAEAAGGVAILDTETNQYFSLNHVGAVVWSALEQGATRDALVEKISEIYAVDPAVCAPDIDTLLKDLCAANLVTAAATSDD